MAVLFGKPRRFVAIEPDIINERNDEMLLIWGDIPFWMVGDIDVLELIRNWTDAATEDEVYAKLSLVMPLLTPGAFKLCVKVLKKGGILREEGNLIPAARPEATEQLIIHLTNRTNLEGSTGAISNIQGLKDELKPEDWRKILLDCRSVLQKKGTVSIEGGEPLLVREKLRYTAKTINDCGWKPIINTNGQLLDFFYRELAEKEKPITRIWMYGVSKEAHDQVAGNGTFDRIIRNIKFLKEANILPVICLVIHKANIDQLENFVQLAITLGLQEVIFQPAGFADLPFTQDFESVQPDELVRETLKLLGEKPEYEKMLLHDQATELINRCRKNEQSFNDGSGCKQLVIDADGHMFPGRTLMKPELSFGSIKNEAIAKILRGDKRNDFLKQTSLENLEECRKCPVRHWCLGGNRGEALTQKGSLDAILPDCKTMQETIIQVLWLLDKEE